MAGNELKITISAQDNASAVFSKIADGAAKVADELEKAGQEGGAGFERVAASADKTSASFAKMSSAGDGMIRTFDGIDGELVKLGGGMQSVGVGLDALGAKYLEQQRQIQALNALYGESSSQFQRFAQEMQSQTLFSDDEVRQAEAYFATLRNNYDMSEAQIRNLIQISADLAQTHGFGLADAALRVQAALRGEAESVEALGLTMNQQSIDVNNLTLSMSNAEAAQFRYNALLQQTANVQGQAQAAVTGLNGMWRQAKNEMQDVVQVYGSAVGPIGNVFKTFGEGASMAGETIRGLKDMKAGIIGIVGAAAGMGPVGLLATGLAAALGVAGYAFLKNKQDAAEAKAAWDAAGASVDDLTKKVLQMQLSGQQGAVEGWAGRLATQTNVFFDQFNKDVDQFLNDITGGDRGNYADWEGRNKQFVDAFWASLDPSNAKDREILDMWGHDGGLVPVVMKAWAEENLKNPAAQQEVADGINQLFDLSSNQYIDQDRLRAGANKVVEMMVAGEAPDVIDRYIDTLIKSLANGASEVQKAKQDLELAFRMDDLRIQGKPQLADDIAELSALYEQGTGLAQQYADAAAASVGTAHFTFFTQLAANAQLSDESAEMVESAMSRIDQALTSGNYDNAAILGVIDGLNKDFAEGTITGDQWAAGMGVVASSLVQFQVDAKAAADAAKALNAELAASDWYAEKPDTGIPIERTQAQIDAAIASAKEAQKIIKLLNTPLDQREVALARIQLDELVVTQDELNAAYSRGQKSGDFSEFIDLGNKRIAQTMLLIELQEALNSAVADEVRPKDPHEYPAQLAASLLDTEEQRKAIAEGVTAAIEEQKQAYSDMFASFAGYQGLDARTMALGMSSFADEAARAGIGMQSVQTGLETTFRIVVDNTNGVSDLAQKTLDWADELIAAEGTWGKIDDLLARGLITQEQYTNAQSAYNEIAQSTAEIQDYTLRIQTEQAPLIARQTEALENQYELIANMTGETQLAALGWMDAAESAKALEINAMAADVAAGRMGASGKAGFEDMLRSAVLLDPALGAMLDKMGLIELAGDGTTILKINYDAATGAESEIAKLTESINLLILALGGIPPLTVDTAPLMTAEQRVKALQAAWDGLTSDQKQGFFDHFAEGATAAGTAADETATTLARIHDGLIQIADGTYEADVAVNTGDADAEVQSIRDLLNPLDGKTLETRIKVLLDDATSGMSKYDQSGPGGEVPTISMQGRVTDIVFDGMDKYDQGGSAGPVVPMKGKVTEVSWDAQGIGDAEKAIDVKAKVTDVDTSALDDAGNDKGITITATANVDDAVIGLYNLQMQADNLAASNPTLTITGDAALALAAVENVNLAGVNDKTLTIWGDNTLALASVENVNTATVDDKTLTIFGDATLAFAAIDNVNNTAVEDKTMTINVVTAYSTTGTPTQATQHGGLIGYASGGLIPHIAAEGDRAELAHYANGGVAVLPREDIYLNPPGTYISPAPANPGIAAGGISIVFTGNFNGSNRLELNEWAERDLLPAINDTLTTHRRQFGG